MGGSSTDRRSKKEPARRKKEEVIKSMVSAIEKVLTAENVAIHRAIAIYFVSRYKAENWGIPQFSKFKTQNSPTTIRYLLQISWGCSRRVWADTPEASIQESRVRRSSSRPGSCSNLNRALSPSNKISVGRLVRR